MQVRQTSMPLVHRTKNETHCSVYEIKQITQQITPSQHKSSDHTTDQIAR